jgi:hypothetical protein
MHYMSRDKVGNEPNAQLNPREGLGEDDLVALSSFASQRLIVATQYPCMRRIIAGFIFGHLYTLRLPGNKNKRAKHACRVTHP